MSQQQPPPYGKDVEAGAPLVNQGYPPQQQPQVMIVGAARTNHPDYLGFSIFNLLCCCCCIGIAAVVKSCSVRSANDRGDPNAQVLSREALTLNKVALGIGIAFNLIWIGIVIALVVTGVVAFGAVKNASKTTYGFDFDG